MSLEEDTNECIEAGMAGWPLMLLRMAKCIDKIMEKLELKIDDTD